MMTHCVRLSVVVCLLLAAAQPARAATFGADPTGRTFNVVDHGADPTGETDSGHAIRRAIARLGDGDTLYFPAGNYRVLSPHPTNGWTALLFYKLTNITIAGDPAGTTLVYGSGKFKQVSFLQVHGVTVRDLATTMDPLPWSLATADEVTPTSITLKFDHDWPGIAEGTMESLHVVDPRTGRIPPFGADLGAVWFRGQAKSVTGKGRTMQVATAQHSRVQPGQTVIVTSRKYMYDAFFFGQSSGIFMHNVTVHAAYGLGLTVFECENVELDGFNVTPEPGRIFSANADATHFRNCRGQILIRNCLFELMGDDGTNVRGTWSKAVAVRDKRLTLKAPQHGQWVAPRVGDELRLSDEKWRGGGKYKVVRVGQPTETQVQIDLDRAPKAGFTWVENLSARPDYVLIENVTVRNARARGVVLQTPWAVVRNCTFEGLASEAVLISADRTTFGEPGPSEQVTIWNNRIIDCNTRTHPECSPINVNVVDTTLAGASPVIHRSVRIINNTIEGAPYHFISVRNANHAFIRGNVLRRPRPANPGRPSAAIQVLDSVEAAVDQNTLENSIVLPLQLGERVRRVTSVLQDLSSFD